MNYEYNQINNEYRIYNQMNNEYRIYNYNKQ